MIKSLLSTLANIPLPRIILLNISGVIVCFLMIQHVGGYPPCDLCIQEQKIYYFGFLIALVADLSTRNHNSYWSTRLLLMTLGLLMFFNMTISVIHVGIECGIWEKNAICMNNSKIESITSTVDLLTQMEQENIPSCNKTTLYVLGLSLAFWNIIVSFFLSFITSIAMLKISRKK
ncbi:disulfide bond formation protein B [Candidatus Liberibacter asiaticus]|uniref:Disulfide bond formation protein B n=3 Tax=Liberibacter asiaticus TaxID=34021 RepID=C6XHU6_LIBAP|nr:disulfide bond formation protein B [Candidatus Liberibacter asiaticus]ACT56839.2 hypothetical protein CLIBASIA_01255 [Candidatus Liberibacter asiaticus str. psy62]ASK52465.1 disulfide bond formation protein B [Candidatus Liberibacter asiaticus]KAE9510421.1 Disulfide bond formation protein B [Candidatus Liberibacter asiaticus]KAE9511192.1 Disulfide bond formation protein B [Candidatus Liberibacter asiaticus]KAE9512553.1 Disulfide bond formation protein B [Candidatus Liberibacter asiaticus]